VKTAQRLSRRVALALFAGLLATSCVAPGWPWPSEGNDRVLVGKTADEAAEALHDLGFVQIEWYGPDMQLLQNPPANDARVIHQFPFLLAEAQRTSGTGGIVDEPVRLLIAPEDWEPPVFPIVVPNFAGTPVPDAELEAEDLGLVLEFWLSSRVKADPDGDYSGYTVNGNHPSTPAGSSVPLGGTVGVIIVAYPN